METPARLLAAALFGTLSLSLQAATPQPEHITDCINGMAGGYACSKVDLASQVSLAALGASAGQDGNDIWGWTDSTTSREYALVGVGNGTAFVDITVPDHPVVLGLLPTHTSNSLWRDIKVHGDYAFIVSEAVGHGMQVFDLTRLRNVASPPALFNADAHYAGFGRAHNIVINEDTGFAYAVGSKQGTTQCAGGLHMIDIATPLSPQFAGCFSADGYTHDAQCVVYAGPDADYSGREICFNSNEDTLTIVDVTNKLAPAQIARIGYPGSRYAHQGWLLPGQRWFLMNDELDEINNGHNTRTHVWDLQDLDNPLQTFSYTASVAATDHNLYVRDQYAYLANYKSGLRILDLSGIAQGEIKEVGFFDTFPASDANGFDGAWSSYPYFASGTVIVSDISRGLFVLRPRLCAEPAVAGGVSAMAAGDNAIDIAWKAAAQPGVSYEVYRELGGCAGGPGTLLAEGLASPAFSDTQASGGVDYGYRVRVIAEGGQCRSAFSACVVASTTGSCTAPPQFAGIASASTPGEARCAVDLSWAAATPSCAGPASYEVHRSTDAQFLPGPDSLIRAALEATASRDNDVQSGTTYYYAVRARDSANGASEDNLVRLAVMPVGEVGAGTWSNGAEPGEPFLGLGGTGVEHVAWHTTDEIVHAGERAYLSGYANSDCIALTTPPIDLGAGGTAAMSFFHRYGIEPGWDGGRVEISTNGTSWTPIAPLGGYPAQITNAGNACAWPVGSGVYSGSSLAWQQQAVDLSSYAGSVQLRWVFATDTSVSAEGWWIDSISIAPAQVSGTCTTIPWLTSLSIDSHEPDASVAGTPVTVAFTLQLDPDEGSPPGGIVSISADGEAESCTAQLPATSCGLLLLQPGARTLVASFAGDGALPAASDSVVHTVLQAQTTLELAADATSGPQSGDLLVSVALSTAENLSAPGGTILVQSDLQGTVCTIQLPSTSCPLSLQDGVHLLTATYSGDVFYAPTAVSLQRGVFSVADLFQSGFE